MIHTASPWRQHIHPETLCTLKYTRYPPCGTPCTSSCWRVRAERRAYKFQLSFNCQPQEMHFFWIPPHITDTAHRRWTFHVFSLCDFQSDSGLIKPALLLLIPSDPPAFVCPNQISLVGLFITASSDCEWCLANGFNIQICRLDATESQQGLSYLRCRSFRAA